MKRSIPLQEAIQRLEQQQRDLTAYVSEIIDINTLFNYYTNVCQQLQATKRKYAQEFIGIFDKHSFNKIQMDGLHHELSRVIYQNRIAQLGISADETPNRIKMLFVYFIICKDPKHECLKKIIRDIIVLQTPYDKIDLEIKRRIEELFNPSSDE